jgi:hypothetical protein
MFRILEVPQTLRFLVALCIRPHSHPTPKEVGFPVQKICYYLHLYPSVPMCF